MQIGEPCEICGRFVEGFKYEKCCDGIDCACHGEILGVCLCSEKCAETYDELVKLERNIISLKAESGRLKKKMERCKQLIERLMKEANK